MKILALDTSQILAVVAVIEEGAVVSSAVASTSVAHSEALLPLVDSALRQAGLKFSGIDGFGVGIGPGSFTGLRIGCATIKALAQVEKKPVIVFSSLLALATSASLEETAVDSASPASVVALVNAYQGMVFAGYSRASEWTEEAATVAAWMGEVSKHTEEKVATRTFCGNGARLYASEISAALGGAEWRQSPVEHISAEGLAATVQRQWCERGAKSLLSYQEIQANYIRPSQAELKWDATVSTRSR